MISSNFPFPIPSIKMSFWTVTPSACSVSSTTFQVTFALSLFPLSAGGNKKVLPTRLSGLNPGKGLLEAGPSWMRDLATKRCCRDVVKDIAHILEGEQPSMARGTSPIHDGIGPGLDGSIPPFSWIMVLVVGLILPIIDVIGPEAEDVLDHVGDLIPG